jgi:4-amino-4-deoxy-L-arabinose transferase-like glycosyltransferase
LITISFVSFTYHPYWFEFDGIYYLKAGETIIDGDGNNVKMFNAPIGGPIIYATINSIIDDGFNLIKIISIISGTGIVLISYYVFRNIFNYKIALLGQIFVAINPRLHILSIEAVNDILPISLMAISLYFITKREIKIQDVIIAGTLLGIGSMIRFQPILVLITILVFLLIKRNTIRKRISNILIISMAFIIIFSPLLFYNYTTHDKLLDNDTNFYLLGGMNFQSSEVRDQLIESIISETPVNFFQDLDLFLKNYAYNLFYHHPNLLFNFDGTSNFSIIPLQSIHFLGMIPVLFSIIYLLKIKLNKINLIIPSIFFIITFITILVWGEITHHFFALIIIPIITLSLLNIKNLDDRIIPLLILFPVFFISISIIPLGVDRLLPIIFSISILNALFFMKIIPEKIFRKNMIKNSVFQNKSTYIILMIITVIILLNITYSYLSIQQLLYENDAEERGKKFKEIGDILSKQPGIENSYIMTGHNAYAYYSNSKMIYAGFFEGDENDSLNSYIIRKNWSDYDILYSNVHSIPINRFSEHEIVPDYLVVEYLNRDGKILEILSNPKDPRIPTNFEKLYQSNERGIIIYKINHNIENIRE